MFHTIIKKITRAQFFWDTVYTVRTFWPICTPLPAIMIPAWHRNTEIRRRSKKPVVWAIVHRVREKLCYRLFVIAAPNIQLILTYFRNAFSETPRNIYVVTNPQHFDMLRRHAACGTSCCRTNPQQIEASGVRAIAFRTFETSSFEPLPLRLFNCFIL